MQKKLNINFRKKQNNFSYAKFKLKNIFKNIFGKFYEFFIF